MQCPSCHSEVRPGARFCGICGHDLTQSQCPQCGQAADLGRRFCAKCGWEFHPTPVTKTPPLVSPPAKAGAASRTDNKKTKVLLIAAVAVLSLLVLAVVVWVALNRPTRIAANPEPKTLSGTPVEGTMTPEATPFSDDPDALWQEAQKRMNAGDRAGAVILLRQLRASHPDYRTDELATQLTNACRLWYEETAHAGAVEVAEAIACLIEVEPSNPVGQELGWWEDYFQAKTQVEAGNSASAVALLEPLIAAAPSTFAGRRHILLLYDAYLQVGDAECAAAQYDVARQWFLKANQLDPARREAIGRLSECKPPTDTPTPTPTATITPTPLPPGAMQAVFRQEGRFNLRAGPGLNYPIAAIVEAGAVFTITGRTEDAQWLEAQDAGKRTVWALAEFLDLNYPAAAAALVSQTPVPPTNYLVADSVADFSTTQGANRWLYLASKSAGVLEFEQIPVEGTWYRWTKGGRSPEMRLSAEGSYPSWNSDAARLWVNFYEGQLRIEGQARKEQGAGNGGDGVMLRVVQQRQPTDGDPGFAKDLWSTFLNPNDIAGLTFQIPPFDVKQRDEIYFITSALGNDRLDNTIFTARIYLMNEGGVEAPPTATPILTPTPIPAPTKPPPPPLCFEPSLRHHERSHGGAGEIVGYVYTSSGSRLTQGAIRIKGPAGNNQWVHDFPLTGDGGYEATLLVIHGPPPFAYTVQLIGPRIRESGVWVLDYPESQPRRAVVDWYQAPCP